MKRLVKPLLCDYDTLTKRFNTIHGFPSTFLWDESDIDALLFNPDFNYNTNHVGLLRLGSEGNKIALKKFMYGKFQVKFVNAIILDKGPFASFLIALKKVLVFYQKTLKQPRHPLPIPNHATTPEQDTLYCHHYEDFLRTGKTLLRISLLFKDSSKVEFSLKKFVKFNKKMLLFDALTMSLDEVNGICKDEALLRQYYKLPSIYQSC